MLDGLGGLFTSGYGTNALTAIQAGCTVNAVDMTQEHLDYIR